ncbi:MAG: DUF2252 family protein [Microthrixaceae bacterium]
MKGSADVEAMNADRLRRYTSICGAILAHAHARSAEPVLIAGYLGASDEFDKALAKFGSGIRSRTTVTTRCSSTPSSRDR